VLIASREPLPPFAEWKLKLSDLSRTSFEDEGVWVFDELGLRPRTTASEAAEDDRGQVVVHDVAPPPLVQV
jgi:hypothetical protein